MATIRDYTVTYGYNELGYETAFVNATSTTQSSYAALPTLAECRTALGIGSIQEIALSDCFHGCTSLTTAPTIPASVTEMSYCFSGCTSLTTVTTIPASVTTMTFCFSGCTSLTGYITIPASVVVYNNIFDNTSQVIFVEGGSNATAISSAYSNVHIPKWNLTHTVNDVIPTFNAQGKAMIRVRALKISDNTYYEITNTNGWAITQISENSWRVVVPVGKDYVVDKYSVSTTATIKIKYDNVETYNPQSQKAFFATSRTANFSNGLANSMFVSGCSLTAYSSKVWYSKVNNPLYFPDTNYIEVGSNDKSIMGLMKIGEYLGIVKQGSTTDTSVYLAYPTTYNDDTTYAVQQEINGIGASAKYCFNVLNDEALFLSKDGVMAINPSGSDENKIRNRSFFVNKRLLAESGIGEAYSFVWRNLYILSVNGHCYVLDGNQKSSWVNEKTNLQYEAYYWDNVPADCFVKCNERLWFSDGENLCRFKDDTETNAYTDNGVAVSAEWSTILDDDGSVHYFKTMQKKGNIVSLLPCGDTSADVYIKADNENPVLIGTVSGSGDLPTEMYINKKFKKYKRLQFIVKNELDQGFGIDSIIKNYTVGNYSKNRG